MGLPDDDGGTIAVSAFRPRSQELIECVASGQVARLVLTERGCPAPVLLPMREHPVELWGALSELMGPIADVDLTAPVGQLGQPSITAA